MTTLTPTIEDLLDVIRARHAAAVPGPYFWWGQAKDCQLVGIEAAKAEGSGVYRQTISGIAHPDAEALRASWQDVEDLLTMVGAA